MAKIEKVSNDQKDEQVEDMLFHQFVNGGVKHYDPCETIGGPIQRKHANEFKNWIDISHTKSIK